MSRYNKGYAQHIKALLADYLLHQCANEDIIIATEVPVHGKASIIDMMLIRGNRLIGFEIKSDFDSLSRLEKQIDTYQGAFHELYLVCGKGIKQSCTKKIKQSTGILTYDDSGIQHVRKSSSRIHLQKSKMINYLWKSDMNHHKAKGQAGVEKIRRITAAENSTEELEKIVLAALRKRYHSRYISFTKSRGQRTCTQDIDILTIQDDYLY